MKLHDIGINNEKFEKLLMFCDNLRVRVLVDPFIKSNAAYDPIQNIIFVSPDVVYDCEKALPVIAHELGHACTMTTQDLAPHSWSEQRQILKC